MSRKRGLVFCLLALLLGYILGCSTARQSESTKSAASDRWIIQSVNLNTEPLSGYCDLGDAPYVQRSATLRQTVYFNGLGHTASADDKNSRGCQLRSNQFGPDGTAVAITSDYSESVPERLVVSLKVGEIIDADDALDAGTAKSMNDTALEEVGRDGTHIATFRTDVATTLLAACNPPVLRGFWGFRRKHVTCTFANGRGSITLREN